MVPEDNSVRSCLIARSLLMAVSVSSAAAQTDAIGLLRANCVVCHGQQNRTSGLALDGRADVLQGGNRGPAVKIGVPAESLLVTAIEQTGDLKMPPGRRLSNDQI